MPIITERLYIRVTEINVQRCLSMVIIGPNMSVHKPFNQEGMREERNPIEASSL